MGKSLQEIYAPNSICFGCGPANQQGLRIRSFVDPQDPQQLIMEWQPEPHHQAFPGVLNGGIVGALLDCHSNWTAAYFLMKRLGLDHPAYTVTSDFHVTLKRPTPVDGKLILKAKVKSISDDRATIEATLESASGKICDTCVGTFVAIKPDHPAYARC